MLFLAPLMPKIVRCTVPGVKGQIDLRVSIRKSFFALVLVIPILTTVVTAAVAPTTVIGPDAVASLQALTESCGHPGRTDDRIATHCLSNTKVDVNSLPWPLVPLVVAVIVFPPFETTVRPVALYGPPVFFRSSVNVLAFTCLIEIVS